MIILSIILLVLLALAVVRCVKDEPVGYKHNKNVVPRAYCGSDCSSASYACRKACSAPVDATYFHFVEACHAAWESCSAGCPRLILINMEFMFYILLISLYYRN